MPNGMGYPDGSACYLTRRNALRDGSAVLPVRARLFDHPLLMCPMAKMAHDAGRWPCPTCTGHALETLAGVFLPVGVEPHTVPVTRPAHDGLAIRAMPSIRRDACWETPRSTHSRSPPRPHLPGPLARRPRSRARANATRG